MNLGPTLTKKSMRIGLVYDLKEEYRALGFTREEVAEFDSVETIDSLSDALETLGCEVDRVGRGQELVKRLVAGGRFDLVFSIAEGIRGRSREAHVPAVCELFDQPYLFSDPLTLAASLDKAIAKRLIRDAGIPTPDFAVARANASELDDWDNFPAFVKPIAEGTSKGCSAKSLVHNPFMLREAVTRLLDRYGQPVLVERYLAGREFTVGVVGNEDNARVVGVCEIILTPEAEQNVYSFQNKENYERLVKYRAATDEEGKLAGDRALAAYHALKCRDAARIDLRSDERGDPAFLEANPLAGLNPKHSDLPILAAQNGVSFLELIQMIVNAGLARYGKALEHPLELLSWSSTSVAPRRIL
jgi:D-alanine-D-alanine ligase